MTKEQKQVELERCRAILLATFDYLLVREGGAFVVDGYDMAKEAFEQQKVKTEAYFTQRRLDRMQQRLAKELRHLQRCVDLNFSAFVKSRTGYDINLFGDLHDRVATIKAQNEIRNKREMNDVLTVLEWNQKTSSDGAESEQLLSLIHAYLDRESQASRKRKNDYSEVVSRTEQDGVETELIRFSTGPKPKHYKEQWIPSPDGTQQLQVAQWSDGNQATTYVALQTAKGASGAIYNCTGLFNDINAFWKDSNTVVIETREAYPSNAQHRQVQSHDTVINIEYREL
ncbi:hypothetical protein [Flaviaesturariibacter amylovorans]|uniref:Uncharacterized protein n=1 Tax=Flaviaesturariibacter amylovorans TaxID=1084520 RepID=A0ABP8GVQ9_9BACT